jgi:hypothetical protein
MSKLRITLYLRFVRVDLLIKRLAAFFCSQR